MRLRQEAVFAYVKLQGIFVAPELFSLMGVFTELPPWVLAWPSCTYFVHYARPKVTLVGAGYIHSGINAFVERPVADQVVPGRVRFWVGGGGYVVHLRLFFSLKLSLVAAHIGSGAYEYEGNPAPTSRVVRSVAEAVVPLGV